MALRIGLALAAALLLTACGPQPPVLQDALHSAGPGERRLTFRLRRDSLGSRRKTREHTMRRTSASCLP